MKVGDSVIAEIYHIRTMEYRKLEIIRETPTRWVTKDPNGVERQFHKKNCKGVGSDVWSSSTIYPYEEKEAVYKDYWNERRRRQLWNKIIKMSFPEHVSEEQLKEIFDELALDNKE